MCASVYSILFTNISQPFALILNGPPSSLKTTAIFILAKCSMIYRSDQFTPPSFVSHSASVKREKLEQIDLLPRIKNKCLITKELAPVFGADEDQLTKNISILISVLDGQGYVSDSGVHGQRGYPDPHMFTWLGAIVDIPYRVWKLLGNLGPRLYFLRLNGQDRDEQTRLKELTEGTYLAKVEECAEKAQAYFGKLDEALILKQIVWQKGNDDHELLLKILRIAKVLAHLRAVVQVWETDGSGGSEYNYASPVIEDPSRAATALYNLAIGHAVFHGRDKITEDDLRVVVKVALDSATKERVKLLDMLIENKGIVSTVDFELALGCSKATALKTMKELEIIGLVDETEVKGITKSLKAVALKAEFQWLLLDEFKKSRDNAHTPESSKLFPSQGVKQPDNLEKMGVSKDQDNLEKSLLSVKLCPNCDTIYSGEHVNKVHRGRNLGYYRVSIKEPLLRFPMKCSQHSNNGEYPSFRGWRTHWKEIHEETPAEELKNQTLEALSRLEQMDPEG